MQCDAHDGLPLRKELFLHYEMGEPSVCPQIRAKHIYHILPFVSIVPAPSQVLSLTQIVQICHPAVPGKFPDHDPRLLDAQIHRGEDSPELLRWDMPGRGDVSPPIGNEESGPRTLPSNIF
jgi:hypothetical protein